MIGAGVIITLGAAFGTLVDLPDKVDPLLQTEAEALADHEAISAEFLAAEQTQAGFNAYTLNQLLQQEVKILELQIKQETDDEQRELLKEELDEKKKFIRKLKEEERKQLLKGKNS